MTFQANERIGGILGCPVVGRRVPKTGQDLGTDKTAMDFRRRLPEIRWQSCLSPGELAGDQYASPRLSIPRTRMRSGGSRQKKDPPLADPEAQFTGPVFEGLHIAVACRGETHQGRINPCLDDAIQTRQIAHRGRAENYSADHKPSRRRTSSKGTSSPGSVRARSSLAAVSASMISCSPSSARKEMATCTSVSGRASTSD